MNKTHTTCRYKVEAMDANGAWHKAHRGLLLTYSEALKASDGQGQSRVLADYCGTGVWEEVGAKRSMDEQSDKASTQREMAKAMHAVDATFDKDYMDDGRPSDMQPKHPS